MIKYVFRRLGSWLIMIFLATNLTYFLAAGFLNPRSNYAERRPPLPEAQVDRMLDAYNLNDKVPVFERWWTWLTNIVTKWDWGFSAAGESVNDQIAFRIGVSGQLLLGATILIVIIGVAVGVYTASRQYRLGDRIWQGVSIITMNIHPVVAALVVVLGGIAINNWYRQMSGNPDAILLYVTGSKNIFVTGFFPSIVDKIQHLILPTTSLVLVGYASYHFLMRSLLLDNISADYVRTARAKGLRKPQAIRRHAMRTSLIPIATQVAFSIPALFTGALITEKVYGWQGMGAYFVDSIAKNNVHGVVGTAAFGAAMTAIGAVLSDIVIVFLDPRVRVS